jgi:hypothetical protein
MMRRALLPAALAGLLLAARPAAAAAQLQIDVGEGWTLGVAGNVNAFLVHERERSDGEVASPLALVGVGRRGTAVRTGHLPSFLVFDLRGREASTDLGVHFGFAPQIQGEGAGRIDMRQVYLTAAGRWGRVLAGREIALFGRQTYLADQTLFGIGAAGGNIAQGEGTTLGRSGFGALYPGFGPQITYTLPAAGPFAVSLALADPSAAGRYAAFDLPRLELEAVWAQPGLTAWAGGLAQRGRDPAAERSRTAWGITSGVKLAVGAFTLVGASYFGRGLGTAQLFDAGAAPDTAAAPADTSAPPMPDAFGLRRHEGALVQLAWRPAPYHLTYAASYGESTTRAAGDEPDFRTDNRSVTLGVYPQFTRALRGAVEGTWAWSQDDLPATTANRALTVAAGVMLFF